MELATYSIENGWLSPATRCHCDNHSDRPGAVPIDLLVVHNISLPPGEFGGGWIERFFANELDPDAHPYFADIATLQVSAHLLIERTGQIKQFVNLNRRAWHAGQSCFEGREQCNDFSIGIELEGTDDTAYTDAQYASLVGVTRSIMAAYPDIKSDRICGHSDIAPGRKTDPGAAFDWPRFLGELHCGE